MTFNACGAGPGDVADLVGQGRERRALERRREGDHLAERRVGGVGRVVDELQEREDDDAALRVRDQVDLAAGIGALLRRATGRRAGTPR